MFVHQSNNSIGDRIYNANLYHNIEFITHLHKGCELLYVLDGCVKAELDGADFTVNSGEFFLAMPYRAHAYSTESRSLSLIVVFSADYVPAFARATEGKEPLSPCVTPSPHVSDYFVGALAPVKTMNSDIVGLPAPHYFAIKSALYAVLGEYLDRTEFVERGTDSGTARAILGYIEANFTQDITLRSLADALGYDYRYVSRIFNRNFAVNLKTLVNQYRCDRAKELMEETDEPLSRIAMNSGFQSIRSFNRVFKELTGSSPSDIRAANGRRKIEN